MPQRQASSRRKAHKPSWWPRWVSAPHSVARVPAIAMIVARMSGSEMRGNLRRRSISPDVAALIRLRPLLGEKRAFSAGMGV